MPFPKTDSPNSTIVIYVSSLVCFPRTNSSSCIYLGGLKKWVIMKRCFTSSGRDEVKSVSGIPDVLDVRIAVSFKWGRRLL